jgi:hypothetical protein
MKLSDMIKDLRPCSEAVEWLDKQESLEQAWKECERGDWMLWLLGKFSGKAGSDTRKRLILCCCEVARQSLKYVKNREGRPLAAIETAEKYARNEYGVSIEDVRKSAAYADYAAADAYAADADAAAVYAADAAAAAVYAADAAAAVYAAAVADAAAYADAAAAAVYAADAAADAAARKESLQVSADIVRRHYQEPPVKKGDDE